MNMKNPILLKRLGIFVFPVLYGLLLRLVFELTQFHEVFGLMSFSFLFIGPFIMGYISTYFSDEESLKSKAYIIFVPWISIFIFFVITLISELEGWACWLMVSPLFLLASSIGGYIGAHFRKDKNKKTYVSIAMLLPFLLAPLENQYARKQETFKAYNSIDIHAPAEKIWGLVTRVSKINEADDTGWLNKALGFPRPVEAELNYEGVGAYRKAIFTNGLAFHETVTAYEHQKKMTFDIKAHPHEIPSTTLDEHVVVGGEFFDVLNGTYELEELGKDHYRLHLYSHFTLNTTFNFYASVWAKWIMKDIQQNILTVEKKRAES